MNRFGLTARQMEVTRLIAEGLTNKQIARQMHLSYFTVRNHVREVLEKSGTHSRREAARLILDLKYEKPGCAECPTAAKLALLLSDLRRLSS